MSKEERRNELNDSNGSVPHLWRVDDQERWTRQANGKYTMDNSMMAKPYEYTFGELMRTTAFASQNAEMAGDSPAD